MTDLTSFEEFYPYYIGEHSKPATRWVHFAGTHLGAAVGVIGLVRRRSALLAAAPLIAYGLAWLSHLTVEKNKPATFGHPFWAFRGDLQMIADMYRGEDAELSRMAEDVRDRTGVSSPAVDRPQPQPSIVLPPPVQPDPEPATVAV